MNKIKVKSIRLVDKLHQTISFKHIRPKIMDVSNVYLKEDVLTGIVKLDGSKIKVKMDQSTHLWSQVA